MRIGMYGETPRLKVGTFTICRQTIGKDDGDSVWIESENGEGGEFKDELFEECISDFFEEHL